MQSDSRLSPRMAHKRNALINCHSYCKHLRIVVQIGLRNPFRDDEITSETEVSHQMKFEREMDIHKLWVPRKLRQNSKIIQCLRQFLASERVARVKAIDAPNKASTFRRKPRSRENSQSDEMETEPLLINKLMLC